MDLKKIEAELKKRLKHKYSWGRKQDNYWDNLTNFIYKVETFDDLIGKIEDTYSKLTNVDRQDFFNYATNRWYNYWSAMAIEFMFKNYPNVSPSVNKNDRLVDFSINGITFDHKTSIFPKGFGKSIEYAKEHKEELILWLYDNQSQEQRKHLKNRLFIVVYDKNGEHWKLKSEISKIYNDIELFMNNFDKNNLVELELEANSITYSDIIWATY